MFGKRRKCDKRRFWRSKERRINQASKATSEMARFERPGTRGSKAIEPGGKHTMTAEFQVQKSGLAGQNWTTICRGSEDKAREIFHRQLRLYSVGRFRLVDAEGKVIEEGKAQPLFSAN
jgi:hypothetical protein